MLLQDGNAVVYGAAGSMGGAVARAFAREGARVVLAGRTRETLEAVAGEITAAGGRARVMPVDVHDPQAVDDHAAAVVREAGSLDVSFNAVGMRDVQQVPLTDMTPDDFLLPITDAARSHFATATAAARRMTHQGSGVIVTLSSTAAREWRHRMGGFNVACAAVEAFSRGLAGELGPHGVRVVCVRPNFTPETAPGIDPSDLQPLLGDTLTGRLPLLDEVAAAVVFAASDRAGAMTGAVLNLSCGALVD